MGSHMSDQEQFGQPWRHFAQILANVRYNPCCLGINAGVTSLEVQCTFYIQSLITINLEIFVV